MTVEKWALIVGVAASGLWSGLQAMLTTVLHRVMASWDGPDLARFLRSFLPIARRAPFNYLAIIAMVVAPAVALVALRDEAGGAAFILTAAGLALTVSGPLLVSRFASEPNYDVMLGWDPDSVPSNWKATRARYFALNWIRAVATWAAFALLLAALLELP